MLLSQSSQSSEPSVASLDELPLCADRNYYRTLYPDYPRPMIQRIIRFLLARFALNAVAALGMLFSVAKNIDAILSAIHSQESPAQTLNNSYFWQYATAHPVVAILTVAFVCAIFFAMIPIGLRMRRDEQNEQLAILKRSQGPRLAEGLSIYLHRIIRQASVVPPILLREAPAPATRGEGFESPLPFAPLTLAHTTWSSAIDPVLDPPTTAPHGKPSAQSRPIVAQEVQMDTSLQFVVENSLNDALERSSYGCLVILGPQGAGKTSIFRHLASSLAGSLLSAEEPTGRIPIYLDIAHSGVASLTVSDALRQEVASIPRLDEDVQSRIVKELTSRSSLILIDGLDELLGSQRETALDHIRDFCVEATNPAQPPLANRLSMSTDHQFVQGFASHDKTASVQSEHLVEVAVASRTASYRREGFLDPTLFETWEIQPLNDRKDQLLLITEVLGWLKRRN